MSVGSSCVQTPDATASSPTYRWTNPGSLLPPFFLYLEFLRDLPIAKIVLVEVKQVQAPPVLNFALTDIVQVWLPVPIVNQILCYMRG